VYHALCEQAMAAAEDAGKARWRELALLKRQVCVCVCVCVCV